ncbi:tetratricopeptide repeat protein, partial [bacterium]|nr:tetratricopeptide repeat protein [bacterium]
LITHLEQAIETFNRSIKVLRTLSQLYIDSNQWASAEDILLVLREQTGSDAIDAREILLQLALVYDKKDQIDKVESLLEKAIAQYPQNAEVYNFLGYTYADRNIKLDKALSLIQKAHALDPEDGNIIDSLGWVYYRLGRYEDAVEQLKRAVALMENHPVILDHLGDALLQTGQKQKAIQSWKQALRYGPAYPAEFTSDFKQRIKQKIDQVEKQNLP